MSQESAAVSHEPHPSHPGAPPAAPAPPDAHEATQAVQGPPEAPQRAKVCTPGCRHPACLAVDGRRGLGDAAYLDALAGGLSTPDRDRLRAIAERIRRTSGR